MSWSLAICPQDELLNICKFMYTTMQLLQHASYLREGVDRIRCHYMRWQILHGIKVMAADNLYAVASCSNASQESKAVMCKTMTDTKAILKEIVMIALNADLNADAGGPDASQDRKGCHEQEHEKDRGDLEGDGHDHPQG